jgi:hypothetical protein
MIIKNPVIISGFFYNRIFTIVPASEDGGDI